MPGTVAPGRRGTILGSSMAYEFDRGFVEVMRDELGVPTLDVVWAPDMWRVGSHFRDKEGNWFQEGDRGCWVVVMVVRQCENFIIGRDVITASIEKEYTVFPLDGNHGNPLTPGRWVIDALAASDRARHGSDRLRDVDEWREKKVIAAQKARDAFAKERAHDELFWRALRSRAEELQMATPDKQEMIGLERQAEKDNLHQEAMDTYDRKQSRMYTGKALG